MDNNGSFLGILDKDPGWFDRWYEDARLREIGADLNTAYIWVVFGIGFPANIIIIITIVSMKVMSPATIFVTLLAFFDEMALVTKLIGYQLVVNMVEHGTVLCKMDFLSSFFSTTANWVLVLICAERFISVCYPLQKVYLLTKRRAYIIAGTMCLAFLLLFATVFAVMRDEEPTDIYCNTKPRYRKFWEKWWTWISISLYLFIPFILIMAFTIPIIRGLVLSRRQRRSMVLKKSASGNHNAADLRLLKETERTERMITIMLIVAAIVFLILSTPACLYHPIYRSRPGDRLYEARFKQVAYLCSDLSHAVNFFLYFFTAKRFRSFAFKIFCRCCARKPSKERKSDESNSSRATVSTKVNMRADSNV